MTAPGETLWPLEPHTRAKHLVLRNYLDAWLPILGSWNGRILFIDGFAGPGRYAGGEDGSPLIALRALAEHKAKGVIRGEVCFSFIEVDAMRAKHLRRLVEEMKPSLPDKAKVEVIQGQFDETMTDALDSLDYQRARLAPAFVMIDPFGVSGTPMSVVQRILKNPKAEIYASFMYEAINRFKTTPEFSVHLTELFGCDTWRDGIAISDADARKDFFYSLYENQLRDAGAKQVLHFDLYEGNRLIYAIFFATKSCKGSDLMKQAIWKVAPFGEFAFHGTRSGQLSLGLETVTCEPLRIGLRKRFRSEGWVTIEKVKEFVGSDQTDYHTGQLKKGALAPMEDAGEIQVDAATRRRRRTYPYGTRMRFV